MVRTVALAVAVLLGAAFCSFVAPETVGGVKKCFDDQQDKCHTQCKDKIPADKLAKFECMREVKEQKKAAAEQCLSAAGVTDSSPCFSMRGAGKRGRGGKHGGFGGNNDNQNDGNNGNQDGPNGRGRGGGKHGGFGGQGQDNENNNGNDDQNNQNGPGPRGRRQAVTTTRAPGDATSSEEGNGQGGKGGGRGRGGKHNGGGKGKGGGRGGMGGPEMREYQQCVRSCKKSEGKRCDEGCPAASDDILQKFKSCKRSGGGNKRGDMQKCNQQ